MEELPKNFHREIQRYKQVRRGEWDSGPDLEESEYHFLEETLKEQNINIIKKGKLLEVGSGDASFLDYLRKKGIDAVGIDVDPRGSNKSPQVIARIEQLPFANETFDVVVSRHCVFDDGVYIHNRDLMIKEIARVLKPGCVYVGLNEYKRDIPKIEGLSLVKDDDYGFGLDFAYKKS